ncbi:predicted protein [Histoplasma capsulatum H143]|uniref:Aminoglycoside phosphotransferase domain-containing protein n=1 Tax=Ajellomyces capsulatus (strain H143) TaxID=544712 RepID=C6H2V3_AJECH|nr:predicted protein [Histoplasma capsulatum H143]
MDAASSRTSLQADLIADLFNSHPASQNFPVVPATCYFYHADLGPTNIITVGDGSVIGVLDWESAGYSPKFWIATNRLFLLHSSRLRVPRVDWLGPSFLQEEEGFLRRIDRYETSRNVVLSPNLTTGNMLLRWLRTHMTLISMVPLDFVLKNGSTQ